MLLSLNEENKFDIVHSDEMKEFVSLTEMEDAQCVSQMCRSVGNISEVPKLHSDILQVFTLEHFIRLSSHADTLVSLEVTRCYANLACNFNTHKSIVQSRLLENISALCLSADTDVCWFSVLELANLCLNVKTHPILKGKDLTSVLYKVINDDLPQSHATDEVAFHKSIESKCYACMATSALCQDSYFRGKGFN